VDVRARLQLVRGERESAKAHADGACSASAVANREAQRIERLYDQGLVSDERADIVLGEAQAKEAVCRAMRNMIDVSEARIELTQAQLEQTILRAPFAGTVAEINGEVGEIVTPSPVGVATLPAVDLIDTSCTFVTAPIDEVDAPGIRAGMTAEITLDAFPGQTFPATIRRVAPYVLDREKQARTVDIEAEFNQSSKDLLPGYSADVEVLLDINENVLFLPAQAVLDNERVLVLNDDGILETRVIKSGIRNWQVIEVIDGLSESDRVVLSVERKGVVAGAYAIAEDAAL
jgi:HlyD family secretion protein